MRHLRIMHRSAPNRPIQHRLSQGHLTSPAYRALSGHCSCIARAHFTSIAIPVIYKISCQLYPPGTHLALGSGVNDVIETNILAVALDEHLSLPPDMPVIEMDSYRSVLAYMRMTSVQWVIAGMKTLDMPVWEFVKQMRRISTGQRWALVSSHLTDRDELTARMLGAAGVFEGSEGLEQLLVHCIGQSHAPKWRSTSQPLTKQST